MEKEVEEYLIKNKIVSIPEIQKEFHLGYKMVHSIFSKFLEEKKIFLKDDLNYEYIEKTVEIPFVYKQVLWDCIQNDSVSLTHIQSEFSLSIPTAKTIIDWMTENDFIGPLPFQEVQMAREQFIELFGIMEDDSEEIDEKEDIDSFFKTKPKESRGIREILNSQRENLKKRMQECENKLNQKPLDEVKEEEEDDFDITKYCDISEILNEPEESLDKRYYDAVEKIILVDISITQKEFLDIVNNILKFPFVPDTMLEPLYKKIYDNISQLTEEQFQDLKNVILD